MPLLSTEKKNQCFFEKKTNAKKNPKMAIFSCCQKGKRGEKKRRKGGKEERKEGKKRRKERKRKKERRKRKRRREKN
jgi:hypothetical protein